MTSDKSKQQEPTDKCQVTVTSDTRPNRDEVTSDNKQMTA